MYPLPVHDCYRYMVAGPKDLWNTFDYVLYDFDYVIEDGVTINMYMNSWTKQPGYPLITVTSTGDGRYNVSQVMKKKKGSKIAFTLLLCMMCPRGGTAT